MIDLSDGQVRVCTTNESPDKLLKVTAAAIQHATFTGKGDKPVVIQLLAELEWTMKMAMDEAELAQNKLDLSIDPKLLRSAPQGSEAVAPTRLWSAAALPAASREMKEERAPEDPARPDCLDRVLSRRDQDTYTR